MIPCEIANLSQWCTLRVGGPARVCVFSDESALIAGLLADPEARVLGGGSNTLIADEGVPERVFVVQTEGIAVEEGGQVRVFAGTPWDAVVQRAVALGLSGVEGLSGIPGSTGGAVVQNIGAYGQEIGDVLEGARVLDRATGEITWWDRARVAPSYRRTALKGRTRFVVLEAALRLSPRPPAVPRGISVAGVPSLGEIREAVLAIRAEKGMLAPSPFASAGSFFVNPVVEAEHAARLIARWPALPVWEEPEGRAKLAAAFLIEASGFPRGTRLGSARLSPRHALALGHEGEGNAASLIALAAAVQRAVWAEAQVWLHPEPLLWGFSEDPLAAPAGHLLP